MSSVHHPDCDRLIAVLHPMTRGVRVKRGYWITDPDCGMHINENGGDWCYLCGSVTVLQLQALDAERRDEYTLDGGWRSEHDTPPMCAGCGAKIDGALLLYGAVYELEHFREHPPKSGSADDCYAICEMLAALSFTSVEDAPLAQEAIAIADAMLRNADSTPLPAGGRVSTDGGAE